MTSAFYEKIIGTILLLAGLLIIGQSVKLGADIFLNGKNPPEIFKSIVLAPAKNPQSTLSKSLPTNLSGVNPADLQKMITDNLLGSGALNSIIPPGTFNYLPRMLNLSALGIFLWILIVAGAKISSLGITLIKANAVPKI